MVNPHQLQRPITAKTLLLDLMRASAPDAWPVKAVVEAGKIFDINENALRVNIARLLAKGLLEQDERGSYRLVETHNPLRDWLHRWRQGEDRIVPWTGDWLSLSVSPAVKTKTLRNAEQACLRLGFRQLWQRQWLRPNNLAVDNDQLGAQILSLVGDDRECEFILAVNSAITLPDSLGPLQSLWEVDKIEASYKAHINILQRSLDSLSSKGSDELLRETFILGGEGVHLLSLDPLLPKEFFNTSLRQQLTQLVKDYDAAGKVYWVGRFSESPFNVSPTHLQPSLELVANTTA